MFVLSEKMSVNSKDSDKSREAQRIQEGAIGAPSEKKETEHCEPRMQESRMDCPTDVLSQLRDSDYFLSAGEYDKV